MEWNDKDFDSVTSRIEKINMQFSKLLEESNLSTEASTAPINFKVSLGEIEQPIVTAPTDTVSTNYYANMIEKSRQIKGIPKHAIALDLPEKDRKLIDSQLEKIYAAKKDTPSSNVVYNMQEICDLNKVDFIDVNTRALNLTKDNASKYQVKNFSVFEYY